MKGLSLSKYDHIVVYIWSRFIVKSKNIFLFLECYILKYMLAGITESYLHEVCDGPAAICLFKVNDRNTITIYEICSKLTRKHHNNTINEVLGTFRHIALVFPLQSLNN